MSKPNPFAGEVGALSDADFALLQQAVETRKRREAVGVGGYDTAARKWRPRPPCPDCGASGPAKAGATPAGHQRWLCGECGRRSAYLDGTIFEGAKKPLPTWALFIRPMCYNVRLDAAAELCGRPTGRHGGGATGPWPPSTATRAASSCAARSGWTRCTSRAPT